MTRWPSSNAQADGLIANHASAVARGPTSKLANSIRKEPGRKETVVVIKAGGATTTTQIARRQML